MTEIKHQPWLRCCMNCTYFSEGYDGCSECLVEYTSRNGKEISVDATDICKRYEWNELLQGDVTW